MPLAGLTDLGLQRQCLGAMLGDDARPVVERRI